MPMWFVHVALWRSQKHHSIKETKIHVRTKRHQKDTESPVGNLTIGAWGSSRALSLSVGHAEWTSAKLACTRAYARTPLPGKIQMHCS